MRQLRLQVLVLDAIDGEELRAIVRALVERAKSGDVAAASELLDRTLGLAEAPHAVRSAEYLAELLRRIRDD